jgi:hypothetical protein
VPCSFLPVASSSSHSRARTGPAKEARQGTSDTAQHHCISPFPPSLPPSAPLLLCCCSAPRPDVTSRLPTSLRPQTTHEAKLSFNIEYVRMCAVGPFCLSLSLPGNCRPCATRADFRGSPSSLCPAAIASVDSIRRGYCTLRIRSVASPPVTPRHSLPRRRLSAAFVRSAQPSRRRRCRCPPRGPPWLTRHCAAERTHTHHIRATSLDVVRQCCADRCGPRRRACLCSLSHVSALCKSRALLQPASHTRKIADPKARHKENE